MPGGSGVRRDGGGSVVFQAEGLASEPMREEELEELIEGWCGWRIVRQEREDHIDCCEFWPFLDPCDHVTSQKLL